MNSAIDVDHLPNHLGGHKMRTHTDSGVLDLFWGAFDCKKFIDIGCGPGGQVDLAVDRGWAAYGIDGDYTIARKFPCDIFDFTSGVYQPKGTYDLGWCVEFLEHVAEEYIPNYMPALQSAKYVVVTHALPGEPGHHHVNCQTNDYWVNVFEKYQLKYDSTLTQRVRNASSMDRDFVRRRGLAFVNQSSTVLDV